MMFLLVVILLGAFVVVASRVARHGPGRLWFTAFVTLLLIALGSVLLGRYYDVPSVSRLLLYAVALTGPGVLVPTTMLSFAPVRALTLAKVLSTAILGACLGLALGLIIVVFGLKVW